MSTKEKMLQARQFIEAKQYDKAKKLLQTVDHPKAKEWLARLDTMLPKRKQQSGGINTMTLAIGGSIVVLLIVVVSAIFLMQQSRQASTLAVVPTLASTSTPIPQEPTPTVGPTSPFAYSNTLDNPVPVGQPVVYDAGTLRVLEVHRPIGSALYTTESRIPLSNSDEYVGIKFTFQCVSLCNYPPEANLTLVLDDGSTWNMSSAFSLAEPPLYLSDTNDGWLFFHVPSSASISALHVTNDQTSLFVALQEPRNGYFVDTQWITMPNGTQELRIPQLRRLLADEYPVQDVFMIQSANVASVHVPIVVTQQYFDSEQQVLDFAYPIIATVSRRWSDYSDSVDSLGIAFARSSDLRTTAIVLIDSSMLQRYSDSFISTDELVNSIVIDLLETAPTIGNQSAQSIAPTVVAPTESVTVNQPVQNSASVPQTLDGFEQYILANYSSIGGQSLSIDDVFIITDPFNAFSIELSYEFGGWDVFGDQTEATATEYAERLMRDAEAFFGTGSDILVTVSYSYYTDDLQDFHYDEEWWRIGDYDIDDGWRVSKNYVSAYFRNGQWRLRVWNYR